MILAIRKATPKDFPAILCLIQEFAVFQKTPAKVTITLAQMEKEKDFFQCFVAETSDQTIIGFASFYFTFYSWSGKGIYLDDLYVTEQYRQQKTGNHLLQSVLIWAKSNIVKECAGRFPTGIKALLDFIKASAPLLMMWT